MFFSSPVADKLESMDMVFAPSCQSLGSLSNVLKNLSIFHRQTLNDTYIWQRVFSLVAECTGGRNPILKSLFIANKDRENGGNPIYAIESAVSSDRDKARGYEAHSLLYSMI